MMLTGLSIRSLSHPKWTLIKGFALVLLLGMFGFGGPAQAAPSTTWQMPCYPQGNPDYAFGQYVSGWGYHTGADICGSEGLPLFAPANGVVMYSARTPDSYRWGNLVVIEHTDGAGNKSVTIFGHMGDNRQVRAGQTVNKGDVIGFVGPAYTAANGNWGDHLHFGVRPGPYGYPVGTYAEWIHGYSPVRGGDGMVDPMAYVNARIAQYDYLPAAIAGGGAMYNTSGFQVTFKARNTGAFTWKADAADVANPVRLGSIRPMDRASPFSQGGSGWAGTNRIKLQSDTPSGEVATFTAFFKSNQIPGRYTECFTPVVEGIGWMADRNLCTVIDVLPPSYRSEYVKQLITTNSDPVNLGGSTTQNQFMLPGQKLNVKIILKNVGELTWPVGGPNPTRLGTSNPQGRTSAFALAGDTSIPFSENWVAGHRASEIDGKYNPSTDTVSAASQILPGESAVFSFTVRAPTMGGYYNEYFQPLVEGVTWMPNLGLYIPFRVLDNGYHFEYVSQSAGVTAGSGITGGDVSIRLRNSGRTSWPVNGDLRLGTDRPMDNQSPFVTSSGTDPWLAATRPSAVDRNITVPGKTTIEPGEIAEFAFRITAPPIAPGTYKLYVRPVMDGVAWFPEDYGIYFPVVITAPPYAYQYQAQEFSTNYASAPRGSYVHAKFALKNTGRAAWQAGGGNPVHLGTARPQDRNSLFVQFTNFDAWLAPNRASAIKGKVTGLNPITWTAATVINPGETALFATSLQVPNTIASGTYREYFNLVAEGITWLPDIGLMLPVTTSP